MTKQHCKYNASLVATINQPVLQLPDDLLPRRTVEITFDEMMSALKLMADQEIDDLDAAPSSVPDEAAIRAGGFLAPGAPATISAFVEAGSRPVGNKWEPTEQIYVHPIDSAGAICVAKDTVQKTTWWQLSVYAELSAAQQP